MTRTRRRMQGMTVIALALFMAGGAAAELRSLQVIGVQPIDTGASRGRGVRQAAVERALYEAVSRVALELLDEYGPPLEEPGTTGEADADQEKGENWVSEALGDDMTPYARSFRIVEDQGERPVLFPGESAATREYVVVVDVSVDVDRVRERLAEVGVIAIETDVVTGRGVRLETSGIRHWSAYRALLSVIQTPRVGATDIRPLEFEKGRILLFMEIDAGADEVLRRLEAASTSSLRIEGSVTFNPDSDGRRSSAAEDEAGDDDPDETPLLEIEVDWRPPARASGR